MSRAVVPSCLAAVSVLLAACSASTESGVSTGAGVPGADTSTAPTTIAPGDTAPATTLQDGSIVSDVTDPEPTASDPEPTVPATDPAPSTTMPPAPTSSTTVVYVSNGFDGGWAPVSTWNGSAWEPADFDAEGNTLVPPDSDFEAVSVASLGLEAPLTGLALGAESFACVDDRMGPTIDLPVTVGEIPASSGYTSIAVAGDWDIQPRAVAQVGLDVLEYQAIGESITAAAGVDGTGGDVVQAVRADLDGDGIEEVLVTFEKISDGSGFGTPGDFSVVFARYPTAAGEVANDVLFEYYPAAPTDFPTLGSGGLMAVADLNGDAIMEVALRSSFWETAIVELFSFDGGALTSVGGTGCGL